MFPFNSMSLQLLDFSDLVSPLDRVYNVDI